MESTSLWWHFHHWLHWKLSFFMKFSSLAALEVVIFDEIFITGCTGSCHFWWNFHHRLHWKLSKWQLPVQPVMKISSKWRHFHFSVIQATQLRIKSSIYNAIKLPSTLTCTTCTPTSNGSWCIGIKGEMSGTVCVTFTWDIYICMSCL